MNKYAMSTALAAALIASAGEINAGEYLSGDFHNHTTCSDGSTSVKTLTRESLNYLDWFIHVGHSGAGTRNCNISDFLSLNRDSEFNRGLWVNSLENGADDIKGDVITQRMRTGTDVRAMWRWQSLQEHNLGGIVDERNSPENKGKIAFLGLEWVVPGHEHSSNSISAGNYSETPNADGMAQFEYCFAANSNDTSQGGGQGWTCELSEQGNNLIKALFAGRPEEGPADYNATLSGGINTDDTGDHVKSTAGVLWMQENFPNEAFAVQAHVERQGAFIEDDNEGYNVEHMRDWNTAAPDVAFGFESQPGHQAQYHRGSYNAGRPTSGLFTFGGTGCYGAAEAAKPGMDFDGESLTQADFLAGGAYEVVDDNEPPEKVTLCRPGVRTMWDAMLSEGRKFWFFASSDWHSRGAFGPLDFESTNDFWPGEYQQNFVYVEDLEAADPAKEIVKGLHSGNSYTVQGQLISDLSFRVCERSSRSNCATMGETLNVDAGTELAVYVSMLDPKGTNNSKYAFDNPSLLQIGLNVPVNEPSLEQVDLIYGAVGEKLTPTDAEYYNPLAPETTVIAKTWSIGNGLPTFSTKRLRYSMVATEDSYLRLRGTNIPAGTPNERDADGNPLSDDLSDNIPCSDEDCPAHVFDVLTADLEAWADLWFHSNPVFINVNEMNSTDAK
jgi:hypothetical protein